MAWATSGSCWALGSPALIAVNQPGRSAVGLPGPAYWAVAVPSANSAPV